MLDIQELKGLPQLKDLGHEELKQLTKIMGEGDYSKGEVIFQQQQPAEHFYLVTKGEVSLRRIAPQESPHVSSALGAGAYLGNFSLLANAEYSNTAQALTDCELLVFDMAAFNKLFAENPNCGLKIIKDITVHLCHRLRKMDERYIDMVDYMISGDLYDSRYRSQATPELVQAGAKRLTKLTERELDRIPLFSGLAASERKEVARAMTGCHYQPGEYIFDEHTGEQNLYIIQDGIIKISKMVQQDKLVTLSILRRGAFFGALSLLGGTGHSAAAQAVKDSQVLIMEKQVFEWLMKQKPHCGLKIMNHICQDVYRLLSTMEQDFDYTSRYVWETGPFYL